MEGKPSLSWRRAVYPGSFDPLTYGHLDVIRQAVPLFDEVIVAVLQNSRKSTLFSAQERVALIERSTDGQFSVVRAAAFSGLLVDFLAATGARVIVRGLRTGADLETEWQLASMNKDLMPEAQSIFIPTAHEHSYVSSSLVKEIASHGGDVGRFVPPPVAAALRAKFG